MRENGQDQLTALMRMDDPSASLLTLDPEIGSASAADLSALAIDWMGYVELMRNPVFRETLKGTPEPEEAESTANYIIRIWPLLTDNERGAALDLGLQKMTTVGHISKTGIQVRIWRAFLSGEWQYSPAGENDFRVWVRSVLMDGLSYSGSEASKLSTLCEVIGYLSHNFPGDISKLPKDLESCFRRPVYWKWKTVAPKVAQGMDAYDNIPPGEGATEAEEKILAEIEALISLVYDEDLTHQEVTQQSRKTTLRLKPILLIENRWLGDIHTGVYEMTDAQLAYLRKKLGDTLDYRLEGETYEVNQWTMMQYRRTVIEICIKCGSINSKRHGYTVCMDCDTWDQFETQEEWHSRIANQDTGEFGVWICLESEPKDKGIFESELSDPDMGLEYSTYWVVPDDS